MSFLSNLFSSSNESVVKRLGKKVDEINALEKEFETKSQDQLKELTAKWKSDLASLDLIETKKYLDEILPQAFASVREAAKRTIGQRHYDVQLLGGMVLHEGSIAEMRTGEGKTLVATLPMYLNALAGRGVHLITVNDYLARWQASWMGQIYHYLGLSVASIQHEQAFLYDPAYAPDEEEIKNVESQVQGLVLDVKDMRPIGRRAAYAADIVYGTNNEYGFDYLRDNMVWSKEQMVQRDLFYAIVDEVDSILIDEARTPLIISAPDTDPTEKYLEFAKAAEKLMKDEDYTVDEKHKAVMINDKGITKLEKILNVPNLYSDVALVHHNENALRAKELYKRDQQYVVKSGEIVIVDEFTGRMMYGRRYSEGLHQSIEAKENAVYRQPVKIQQESKTLATITFQNLFRLYHKLSGMTGTAETEAEEFHKIYKLEVVQIPTNKPMVRADLTDQVYKNAEGKWTALIRTIKELNKAGRPILIGTISIERNEMLSQLLANAGVAHETLNAKNNEREAHIIAQAGRLGAVTLATNIAGRGVDIILGGSIPDPKQQEQIKSLGGLAVIGTERHESRRIDNQLRGRAGRQGDPGSSQFFLSLEDDLMRLFGGERVQKMMETLGIPDDQPIEHGLISRSIESAQKKIEGLNFDTRKHVLEYDDVMNKQRTIIYGKRKDVLNRKESLAEEILGSMEKEITELVNFTLTAEEVNLEQLHQELAGFLPMQPSDIIDSKDSIELINHFVQIAEREYKRKQEKLGSDVMNQLEKMVYLRSIDTLWQEHLDTIEHLRDSVRLRGYGQRDPLQEFKNEGYQLFQKLLNEINRQIAFTIFKVDVVAQPTVSAERSALSAGIGRNDPCPCGSGKKWKKCGLLNTSEHQKRIAEKR
ncbi:MAG: preprotein translocase subunit SecA [Candidatus Doudnabacteria bacterium]